MLLNLGSTDKRKCVEEERKRVRERLFLKQGKKETKLVCHIFFFMPMLNLKWISIRVNTCFYACSCFSYIPYIINNLKNERGLVLAEANTKLN